MSTIYFVYDESLVREPVRGHESNSVDLSLPYDVCHQREWVDGHVYQIPLHVKTFMDSDVTGLTMIPRSSCSNMTKPVDSPENAVLRLANTVGFIDWDYRGDWMARIQVSGSHLPPSIKDYFIFLYLYIKMVVLYHLSVIEKTITSKTKFLELFYLTCHEMKTIRRKVNVSISSSRPVLQVVVPPEHTIVVTSNLSDVPEEIRNTSRGEGGFGSTNK